VTVTLVWERGVTETDPAAGGSAVGQVDAGDTYAYDTLADLDLRLKFQDTEVLAASLDIGSTVEHLHYPLPQDIDAFDLSIEVNWNNSSSFTNPIPYAIAWWVVPEPSALLVLVLGSLGLALIWRRWGAA